MGVGVVCCCYRVALHVVVSFCRSVQVVCVWCVVVRCGGHVVSLSA